jgi:nucleotide-binding universal stress UspA family protein
VKIRRILVPVDFSEQSDAALEYAIGLASPLGATVVLIHAVEPIYFAGAMYGGVYGGPIAMEQVRAAEGSMANLVASLQRRKVAVRGSVVSGIPQTAIIEAAKSKKADLIVMGTHGRTGLGHLLIGSVAEKIIRSAECPVLTTPGRVKSRSRSRPKKKAA